MSMKPGGNRRRFRGMSAGTVTLDKGRRRRGWRGSGRSPGRSRHGYMESALRSSSWMEVLARVCASTRLTITAQARLSAPG